MAAAPDPAVQRMEKLLECCFCTETLTKPRTLSCFHSFCHNCLERYVATRRKDAVKAGTRLPEIFECPICRTEFHVKESESVEKIPSNFFINNLLELLSLQQQAQSIKCQACKGNDPATSRCVSCDKYLCGKCLEAHNNWSDFDDHIVMTIEELAKPENRAKARGKPRCDKHKKVLKFYCEKCKVLVCRYCIDLNHPRPEHSWFPLVDVVEKKKEALKTSSAVFEKQMNEAVESDLKIEYAIKTLENNAAKAKDAIKQQQQEILNSFAKKIDEQTAVLLDQVDKKYNEVNKPLMKQHADVKAYLEKAKSSLDFVNNIISNGADEDILLLKDVVEKKAKGIRKERPGLMHPVIPVDKCVFVYRGKSSKDVLDNAKLNELGEVVVPLQSLLQNSTILQGNIQHGKQLLEWVEDEKFGMKLCYRASVDGWRARDFHRKCDHVGPTVTLVKCRSNVFGGYTDQSWKKTGMFGGYKRSTKSFLFSLRNKDNLKPFKCPIYDYRNDKAILCGFGLAAVFGHDLRISSNANTNELSYTHFGDTYRPPSGYEPGTSQTRALLAGSCKFTPTEIEVFCN